MIFFARDAKISPRFARIFALGLVISLSVGSLSLPAPAQSTQPAGAGVQHLYINILEGEGALNNIRQRDAREPVVQVTDENHKPVAGVALLFLIHSGDTGGTATFGTGASSLGTTTNAQGIAHVTGLHVGQAPGSFTITVSASLGTLAATAVIHQSNIIGPLTASTSAASGSNVGTTIVHHGILHLGKTALITTAAVATAAVVAGVIVATKGNDSTTVTLGSSTVGHP